MQKQVSSALRTKQFNNLINKGLKLISTERQLNNGTLTFTGTIRKGRKVIRPIYSVTANGAVISNKFVARRVQAYRDGLEAIQEIFSKRVYGV